MKTALIFASLGSLLAACSSNGTNLLPQASVNPRVLAAVDRGLVPAGMTFDLVVGVKMRNASRLPLVHQQLADRGDSLSPDEFGDQFGASRADYARFVAYLAGHGFEIVRTTPGRTAVTVRGVAAAIREVFGVDMHSYADRYGEFTATPTPVSVANEVFNDVSGVVGIDNSRPWFSHMVKPAPVPEPQAVAAQGAAALQTRYSEDATTLATAGQGQTIAILSTNRPTLVSDVTMYLAQQKPANHTALDANQYTQVFVGGPNRDADSSLAYGENALDAELVFALAPFAKVVQVFTATNGPGLFTDGISYIVNQMPEAHTVTVSWGTCERGSAGEMPVMNALFAQAKAQGQQWFFASGDSGADGCRDGSGNKIISADWPASSPYVVGVGGTTSTTATADTAWNLAGGAPSESFDKPAFQVGSTPADGARDVPDVSAIAGGSGVTYYDNGSSSSVLGTSVASPVFAGAWAVLNQKKGGTKGITTGLESIYTLGKAGKGFNDVTTGANAGSTGSGTGGYAAGTGYDLVTGWGTPNLTSLIANWQ
jgi:kumamolisin